MRKVLSVIGFALVSMIGSSVFAQHIATIDLVSVNGSGCKKNDFAVAISPDNTAFTVTYNNYSALAGSGTSILDHRKNCVLDVSVTVPNGFTYGIAEADQRGYAHLETNASGTVRTSFWFQGNPATGYVSHDIRTATVSAPGSLVTGVLDDNWETTDETQFASIVWNTCSAQRNLNVDTELRVSSPATDPTSLVTEDAVDGSLQTLFHLAFKKCP